MSELASEPSDFVTFGTEFGNLPLAWAVRVLAVLRSILAELDLTIGLSGHTRPGDLGPELLVREGEAPG